MSHLIRYHTFFRLFLNACFVMPLVGRDHEKGDGRVCKNVTSRVRISILSFHRLSCVIRHFDHFFFNLFSSKECFVGARTFMNYVRKKKTPVRSKIDMISEQFNVYLRHVSVIQDYRSNSKCLLNSYFCELGMRNIWTVKCIQSNKNVLKLKIKTVLIQYWKDMYWI